MNHPNNPADNPTEMSLVGSSSILIHQRQRNHPQLTDRTSNSHRQRPQHSSKFVRAQSRTHSSSSDERAQVAAISQLSSNDTSDDDDDINVLFPNHSRLRRKYVKNPQSNSSPPPPPPLSRQQSLREQTHTSPSPTLRNASNGISLRTKQQQQFGNTGFQSSSKDMGKKLKRFTLDNMDTRWHHQYQMVPNNQLNFDPNIYRSSMAIVPSLNANVYGAQANSDLQIRPKVKQSAISISEPSEIFFCRREI